MQKDFQVMTKLRHRLPTPAPHGPALRSEKSAPLLVCGSMQSSVLTCTPVCACERQEENLLVRTVIQSVTYVNFLSTDVPQRHDCPDYFFST